MTNYYVGTEFNKEKNGIKPCVRVNIGLTDKAQLLSVEEAEHLAHLLVTNAEICKILPKPKT